MRAPRFFLQIKQQALAFGRAHQAKVRARVVAAGGQLLRVVFGLVFVKGFAHDGLELIGKALGVGDLGARELDDGQPDRFSGRGLVSGLPLPIRRLVQRQPGQLLQLGRRHGLAQLDQLGGLVEIAGTQSAQFGCQQHVLRTEQGEAALHVLFGQDAEHLRGEAAHRRQRLAPGQGCADVHRDQHIGPHGSRHVDGQVVDQHAVAEDLPVQLGRCKHPWHAHARAQRVRQIARAQHHLFS